MGNPKKGQIQMSYAVMPEVRTAVQEIRLIRMQRGVGRYTGAEVVEDAIRTLLELEKEAAVIYDKEHGAPKELPELEILVTGPKPVLVTGAPKYAPLNIPHFEPVFDQQIPNFTDEQIQELLKKVAEGK